jgi:hypothetical protein
MNTGQMFLTLGAMMLISILVLRVSSTQLTTQDSMQNSKFGILAISLASSLLEQATQKAFDEASTDNFVSSLSSLTKKAGFGGGKESGEIADSIRTFDDYDDFDNYTNIDSTMPSAFFEIHCTVDYVDPNLPGFISANNTWHKMMTVTVTSPSMTDAVILKKVFSYWKLP